MAFIFDSNKTFDENLTDFLTHLDGVDPECAKILRANLNVLLGDGSQARANRAAFNEAVLKELDALVTQSDRASL